MSTTFSTQSFHEEQQESHKKKWRSKLLNRTESIRCYHLAFGLCRDSMKLNQIKRQRKKNSLISSFRSLRRRGSKITFEPIKDDQNSKNDTKSASTSSSTKQERISSVRFSEKVRIIEIESCREYSQEKLIKLHCSGEEFIENYNRNKLEYYVDENGWRTATEEDSMIVDDDGYLHHPVHSVGAKALRQRRKEERRINSMSLLFLLRVVAEKNEMNQKLPLAHLCKPEIKEILRQ